MKILHLCLGNFFIDNYSYQENMLPKYHVKQGHEVLVIASLNVFDKNGEYVCLRNPSSYFDPNGFKVIRLAYKKPAKWNSFLRHFENLKSEIESFSPDIIFSHNLAYGDTRIVRRYVNKHPQTKVFADNHADYINSAKNWFSKHILHPVIWRHFSKILEPCLVRCYGVTPMRCRFLKEMYHINPSIIEYLPLGVDDDLIPLDRNSIRCQIRYDLGVNEDDFLIITGGKIDRLKNTHILVNALIAINNPKIHLVICGVITPEMEYIKSKFEENRNIHYLGWCNAEQVMNYMVSSDLACFPGTHSTLWEQSVGVGLPAIFKRWPEMDHVNVNENCIFVKGEDVEELIGAIDLMTKRDTYCQYKRRAINASSCFLYSNIAKRAIE